VGTARPGSRGRAKIALRPAVLGDSRNVWAWRNDEETRRASFDSSYIDFSDHERWFAASLQDPKRRICVVTADGDDVGVVRLDLEITRRHAVVSIFLDPRCQGRGIGPEALRLVGTCAARDLKLRSLLASVKPDNYPSRSAFRSAGFTESPTGPTVTFVKSLHVGHG